MRTVFFSAAVLALAGSGAEAASPKSGNWLYVVKSRSSDAARESAYNDWYDRIDVPDVLAVPGFARARRGEIVDRRPDDPEGTHVAIYDIVTTVIDRTIVDLYVGARRMTWRGRTTDLLKVTEANYYKRTEVFAPVGAAVVPPTFVRLGKVLCCQTKGERTRFERSFGLAARSAMAVDRRITQIGLYRLYRVMETEAMLPGEVPHYLVAVEFAGAGCDPVLPTAGRAEGSDTRTYQLRSDVSALIRR